MTQTPRHSSQSDRIGGGGAATSAGIRFEQQLGALFSSWILAGDRFDDSFRLGSAAPEWIRFETEAPVDDLLIKTSDGGYVAVQAKTTTTLSEDPNSPLGKTIVQFVRHWFVAQQGDGSMEWNRPLDPSRDRLVLAVSPQASFQIRSDLPNALRLVSQPGGGSLNQAQQRAYQVFSNLVAQAWASITKTPIDDQLLSELAKLVVVFTFDGERGSALASGSLVKAFGTDLNAETAFTALSDLSGRLMQERGGGDLSILRQLLVRRGIVLSASPEYRADIQTLRQHSKQIAEALGSYEKIEVVSGAPLSVRRDCQTAVEIAVQNGPLLIIGEPGAGKSGVLNALARQLGNDGFDILQLAVDRYSIESLEGLSREIGLRHPLLDVLEAWDGPGPAFLIVDALDATRGGHGEGVFRALIERVLERKGRWSVVASIRNFDLRMGQQLRALFKGKPPEASLADPSFAEVQHIQVPLWSEAEFDQLLHQSPELARCLAKTPSRLRDLAMVPFNTRLLCELILGDSVKHLDEVASQADLLRLYWDHRVEGHGLPARSSLSLVVQLMVQARALRAPTLQAAGDNPAMIDTLCKEGVLVVVDAGRGVQFRHHLLFDYAAARLALDPSTIVNGAYRFSKADALGLMLSPALGFVLREVWESETNHARFWIAVGTLINDDDGDPIIRSTAGRLGAEFPVAPQDCLWLGNLAKAGDNTVSKTLSHIAGALVVQLEDEKKFASEPWAYLADCLASAPTTVASNLRFLLHILIERVTDVALKPMLGKAARALLAHGLALPEPAFIVRSAIGFVIATYGSDVEASRELLIQLFDSHRMNQFGHEEVPAVCYKIAAVGDIDPEFVTNYIYRIVFDYEVREDRQTRIGQSQILSLTSNARQDYEMARWSLGEYLPKFLQSHPRAAVRAVMNAVEGYVAREHSPTDDALDLEFLVSGHSIRLREDRSYIWAHDPDSEYDRDANSLVSKLRTYLKGAPEAEALALIDILIQEASFAIVWSRMFLCAVERGDGLVNQLWSIAVTEPFLILPDTRKDAIDLVAKGIGRRSMQERQAFEQAVFGFDFSSFKHRTEARQAFLERVFSAIGRDNLVTPEALQILDAKTIDQTTTNERLFAIHSGFITPDDFHWIKDLNREAPENSRLIDAINVAKNVLRNEPNSDTAMASLTDILAALQAIRTLLSESTPHIDLQLNAEAIIGQGCEVIVSRELLISKEVQPTPQQDATFAELLDFACRSESPELNIETEAQFEESASWGSPAARIEAAQAYWDLFMQRPDLYPDLARRAEELLFDRHPAVRLNAAVRLVRIWDLDRDRFWLLLKELFTHEQNLTVIEHLVGDIVSKLVHTDQPLSLELLLVLLQREKPGSDRERRLFKAIANKLTVLWITYQVTEAKVILDQWLSVPWKHADEAKAVLATLREAIVAGVGDIPDKNADLRQRSQALVYDIVNAANAQLAKWVNTPDLNEVETTEARECASLIDTAGMQMFFATSAKNNQHGGDIPLSRVGLEVFFQENADLLKRIGEYASPNTTYYMLQLVERLIDVDASAAFDLAASTLKASRRSGYQNESLGVELLVQLVGVFLADHKEIFEIPTRRAALVDCLEVFLEAGWPAARRLLYRLPELIQ